MRLVMVSLAEEQSPGEKMGGSPGTKGAHSKDGHCRSCAAVDGCALEIRRKRRNKGLLNIEATRQISWLRIASDT